MKNNTNKKEAVLIVTWILVLIVALVVPQCTRENAEKAREQYKSIQNPVNQ